MGKNDAKATGQAVGDIIQRQRERAAAKRNSTPDSNAASDGGQVERQPAATDGITVIGTDKEKIILGLPLVEEAPIKKKRAPKKAAKKSSLEDASLQIAVLLKTVSDISALRVGKQWSLSAEEAQAIATPLTSIMDRHNMLDKMGEYGDWIALGVAVSVAAAPRVMYTLELRKARRIAIPKEAAKNVKLAKTAVPEKSTTGGNVATPTTGNGDNQNLDGGSSPDGIPSIKQLSSALAY
jgi:hypothetical protein